MVSMPTLRTRSGCCARTAGGPAVTPPPINEMNSRPPMSPPRLRQVMVAICPNTREGAVSGRLMSALGQKRTSAVQHGMSALPPKADMCGASAHVRFGPKADSATQRSGARTPTSKAADRLFVTGLGTYAHLTFFKEGEPRTEGQKYVRMKYSVCPCHLSER